uniref:UDP-3-O-acyl-N-acetylglucosamine deacetylase n=1 Tax=Aegilops tauschii subsp. strangulata TaxID=200361 RepID=A0A453ILL6_AEGTS
VARAAFSWKPTGRAQQTLAAAVSRSGVGLHSGARATATLLPARAGEGRYFVVEEARVAAEVGNAEPQSPLCTTLRSGSGGARVRTVEHLLSAMEALGVDNCRVEVSGGDERKSGWRPSGVQVCVRPRISVDKSWRNWHPKLTSLFTCGRTIAL